MAAVAHVWGAEANRSAALPLIPWPGRVCMHVSIFGLFRAFLLPQNGGVTDRSCPGTSAWWLNCCRDALLQRRWPYRLQSARQAKAEASRRHRSREAAKLAEIHGDDSASQQNESTSNPPAAKRARLAGADSSSPCAQPAAHRSSGRLHPPCTPAAAAAADPAVSPLTASRASGRAASSSDESDRPIPGEPESPPSMRCTRGAAQRAAAGDPQDGVRSDDDGSGSGDTSGSEYLGSESIATHSSRSESCGPQEAASSGSDAESLPSGASLSAGAARPLRCMNTAAHVCVRRTRPAARPALCQLYPHTIMRFTNTVTRSLRVPSSMMSACMLTTGHVFTLHPREMQTRLSFQTCSMPHHMRCIRVEAETTRGLCRGVWPHRRAAIFGTAGLPHCAGSPGVMGVRRTLLWSPCTDAQTLTESCLMQRRMLRLVISSGRLHVHSHTRAQCSPAARRQAIGAVARAAAEGGCRDRGAAHC